MLDTLRKTLFFATSIALTIASLTAFMVTANFWFSIPFILFFYLAGRIFDTV